MAFKDLSTRFKKIQARLSSNQFLKQRLSEIRSSRMGEFVIEKAEKSKPHIEALLKDFPVEVRSFRPYFESQKKNFKSWEKALRTSTGEVKQKSDRQHKAHQSRASS